MVGRRVLLAPMQHLLEVDHARRELAPVLGGPAEAVKHHVPAREEQRRAEKLSEKARERGRDSEPKAREAERGRAKAGGGGGRGGVRRHVHVRVLERLRAQRGAQVVARGRAHRQRHDVRVVEAQLACVNTCSAHVPYT